MIAVWSSEWQPLRLLTHCPACNFLHKFFKVQTSFKYLLKMTHAPHEHVQLDWIMQQTTIMYMFLFLQQFSVPQIQYPPGGSSRKVSHVYFLLIVAMVLLLWHQIVLLWDQVTMVAREQHLYQTIVLPRKLATGSIFDYPFLLLPPSGYSIEVLRTICWPCLG